jgi:GntR family transcriptional regulator
MLLRPNPSSGAPIYLQLMEQVKHGIETGALRPGEPLPGVRPLAQELVIHPNTVARAYRELESVGLVHLRDEAGALLAITRELAELSVLGSLADSAMGRTTRPRC